ncbi:hypothetical protein ACDX66_01050 [Peribacillus frigoritolerans]
MLNLDKKIIEEIIKVSNHKSEKSVIESFESGCIEVYPNKEGYLKAGWTFENDDNYAILNDGKVIYFE